MMNLTMKDSNKLIITWIAGEDKIGGNEIVIIDFICRCELVTFVTAKTTQKLETRANCTHHIYDG